MTEEGSLKSAVDDYLQVRKNQGKLVFLRLNAGDFIEARGKTRRRIKGCPKGTADFEVIKGWDSTEDIAKLCEPRVIFLELKGSKAKQTKEQKEFEQSIMKFGCEYHVVRSLEDLQKVIE